MSEHPLQRFLRTHNYSYTKPRQIVFSTLEKSDPLTMSQLIHKIDGQIDRVTVYRAVELFEKLGVIHRIPVGWKYKLELSETFQAHHHHLSCKDCGGVIAIHDDALETTIQTIARHHSFALTAHYIELQGQCRKCNQTKK